jgi:hypothetical protein
MRTLVALAGCVRAPIRYVGMRLARDPRDRRREMPAVVASALMSIVAVLVGCLALIFVALVIHG